MKYPLLYVWVQEVLMKLTGTNGYFSVSQAREYLNRAHNIPSRIIPAVLHDMVSYGMLERKTRARVRVVKNDVLPKMKEGTMFNADLHNW